MTQIKLGGLNCQITGKLDDGGLVVVILHGFGAPGFDLVGLGRGGTGIMVDGTTYTTLGTHSLNTGLVFALVWEIKGPNDSTGGIDNIIASIV